MLQRPTSPHFSSPLCQNTFWKRFHEKINVLHHMFVKLNLDFFLSESFLKRKEELDRKTKPKTSKIFCVCLIASRIFLDHLFFKATFRPKWRVKKVEIPGFRVCFFQQLYWYLLILTDINWYYLAVASLYKCDHILYTKFAT